MEFYYPNFINDMWRIFGLIYFNDKDALVDTAGKTFKLDEIKRLLTEKRIALSDTGVDVVRTKDNASDKWLRIERPIDLGNMLSGMPDCSEVATTGEKAAGVIAELTATEVPKVGEWCECRIDAGGSERLFRHWRMPSSSRAYPMKLEKKADYYRTMLKESDLL